MKKNKQLLLLSMGFAFIAAGVLDEESRGQVQKALGLPDDFGKDLFGSNEKMTGADFSNLFAGLFEDEPADLSGKSVLSQQEVYDLANNVYRNYGITATAPQDLVVFAYIESSFRPHVSRQESRGRASYGLMQTLLGTAQDMYSKGYKQLGQPTEETLRQPLVSMYFGAAYLDWLKKHYSGYARKYGNEREYYIRAYNGGAGWQQSQGGRNGTLHYLGKFNKARAKLYGGIA